jgi:2-polyprenyl-6-methoxyphenol hydroxylase-like FAD-dependent oxidoreductase
VEFRFGTKLTDIVAVDELDGSSSCVVIAGDSHLECDMIVGADGHSSVVRSILTDIPSETLPVTDLTLNFVVAVDEVADADSLKPIIGSRDVGLFAFPFINQLN